MAFQSKEAVCPLCVALMYIIHIRSSIAFLASPCMGAYITDTSEMQTVARVQPLNQAAVPAFMASSYAQLFYKSQKPSCHTAGMC